MPWEAFRLVGDAQLLWTACTDALRSQVSDGVWHSTFAEASPTGLADGNLTLSVPSAWAKDRIEGRYVELLRAVLADAGAPGIGISIQVRPTAAGASSNSGTPPLPVAAADDPAHANGDAGDLDLELAEAPPPTAGRRAANGVGEGLRFPEQMNPRYTFDGFVTGASNRFAHAAALSVAETPARSYNPLFIYGHSGLGKTHLLQAIGHYVHENYPQHRVRYVSTEAFLNEFVESIRTGKGDAFKRRYRDVDVLLVDDIQFIEGKKETQEEFFHTFNTLHEANRQIVLSSDRAPDAISTLEDRLRGRFKMGLITDIQPPDLETRLAILRKKAERERTAIPPDVLEFIATHITDNIRVLEGALIRVAAFASLTKEQLSIELAERVLSDILTDRQPRQITPVVILDATSRMFGFSVEEIQGKSRRRPLVTSRQIAMYVFRELTDLSYPAIAREFGGRDHTTVMHAVEKISALMGERRQIYDQVTELIQSIKTSG